MKRQEVSVLFRSLSLFVLAAATAVVMTACDNPASAPTGQSSPAPGQSSSTGSLPFKVGQKYTYEMAVTGPASATSEMSIEVVEVSGSSAKIKTTVSVMGQTQTTESMITSASQIGASSQSGDDMPQAAGTESVTVDAGTFTCTKYVYTKDDAQISMNSTSWVNDEVGLVKSVTMSKPKVDLPAGMPGVPSLDTTTTLTLKSYTK